MSPKERNREATASIKGYLYQFYATILKILELGDEAILTVEGLEDFDTFDETHIEHYQCKYYEAQKQADHLIRDAILPMLKGFLALDSNNRGNRKYFLYVYYKESTPGSQRLTLEWLKKILVTYKWEKVQGGKNKKIVINLQAELNASDTDLSLFINAFSLKYCEEFEIHKARIVDKLVHTLRVTKEEANNFSLPTALTIVSNLAIKPSPNERQMKKDLFIMALLPSLAMYNAWTLRLQGNENYCKSLRKVYFNDLNRPPVNRFFIIEVPPLVSQQESFSIVVQLIKKWSTHASQRTPESERYAPYILLRNLPDDQLAQLKKDLLGNGMKIIDGYPFKQAEFTLSHLNTPQTKENRIAARLLTDSQELVTTLTSLTSQKEIYQFYLNEPLQIGITCQQVDMLITSLDMVKLIA